MNLTKEDIASSFKSLQDDICGQLTEADGEGQFMEDLWERQGGGGGCSRVLDSGRIIEKGGVNFSAVYGATPPKILDALQLQKADFYATGVSIVMHPRNPWVPIIHMNIRYFEMSNGVWWFGGGIDLTPHYVDPKQAGAFHRQLKATCDHHHPEFYGRFKPWADDYFYIRHRKETRGVGGIFFDRLNDDTGMEKSRLFDYVMEVGKLFGPMYTQMTTSRYDLSFGEKERTWQLVRRGRYVEFNLVYDKGTKFGLETEGRIESILMSLPPLASWQYNLQPEPGSPEHKTLEYLKKDIDWLQYD